MRPRTAGIVLRSLALVVTLVLGCSSKREEAPAPAPPVVPDAAVVSDAAIVIDAPPDAVNVDAPPDASIVDAAIDAGTRPRAKKPRKSSRAACLAECERRNRFTDCADSEGMGPCPCHCK